MRNILYPVLLCFIIGFSTKISGQSCPSGTTATVTVLSPTGPGSLSWAIGCLNSQANIDTIDFRIDVSNAVINGSGYPAITSASAVIMGINTFDNKKMVLKGDGSSTTFSIFANNVEINNLVIEENDTGIAALNRSRVQLSSIDFNLLQTAVSFDGCDKSNIDNCIIGNIQQFGVNSRNGLDLNIRMTDVLSATSGGVGFKLEDEEGFLIDECDINGDGKAANGIEVSFPTGNNFNGVVSLCDIYNWEKGIEVKGGLGDGVYITRNSFYCNSTVGIDTDISIAIPIITSATPTSIKGTADPGYQVQVYYSDVTCTGICQGEVHIETVVASATGQWTVNGSFTQGADVTATQTRTNSTLRNTSEFSACAFVSNCPTANPVTVKNTNNAGFESLRWACDCVNNVSSLNEIDFDIGTGGAATISLSSALPIIVEDLFFIDGNNPSSSSSKVTINGSGVSSGSGLVVVGLSPRIEDLIIRDFPSAGLIIANASPSGMITNVTCGLNGLNGFYINGDNATVTNCQANDNTGAGFVLADNGSTLNLCSAKDNTESGVRLDASINSQVLNSTFSGSDYGIFSDGGHLFLIEDNVIGSSGVGNTIAGVYAIKDVAGTYTTPRGIIRNNDIFDNGSGVVADMVNGSPRLIISENSMNCNTVAGIEQTVFAPTPPNVDYASPSLIKGSGTGTGVLEIFINTDCPTAPCQGKTHIGTVNTTGFDWVFNVPGGILSPGDVITTTFSSAINTSEFSTCTTVGPACPTANPVTVTNNNDSGSGSLRWACNCVNNEPPLTDIIFSVGSGNVNISPGSQLPIIVIDNFSMDGSNPGASGSGLVTIEGTLTGTGADGFVVEGNDGSIRDLYIGRYGGDGIIFGPTASNASLINVESVQNGQNGFVIEGPNAGLTNCIARNNSSAGFLSTDNTNPVFDFCTATDNFTHGFFIKTVTGPEITNSTSTGNANGVFVDGSSNYLIEDGFLGTTASGNSTAGVSVRAGSNGTIVNNVIDNNGWGVFLDNTSGTPEAEITQNEITCNTSGGINQIPGAPPIPVISFATTDQISGTVQTSATVEIFINTDCAGVPCQGKTLVGRLLNVDDGMFNPTSNWTLNSASFMVPVPVGAEITATATLSSNTSEFATCTTATAASAPCPTGTTVTVLNTLPDGDFSLYWAMECVEADPALDIIEFSIPSGTPMIIQPTTQLPFLSDDEIFIDGGSQPTGDRIFIDGGSTIADNCFEILGGVDFRLKGVGISNWNRDGIQIQAGQGIVIDDVEFVNNTDLGLRNAGAVDLIVNDCVFSGNARGILSRNMIDVSNSTFTNNSLKGIDLLNTSTSTLDNVTISGSQNAIFSIGSNSLSVINSNLNSNVNGIYAFQSPNLDIRNNSINNNSGNGVLVDDSYGTNSSSGIITLNDIYENTLDGILVSEISELIQILENSIYCNDGLGINRFGNDPLIPVVAVSTTALISGNSAEANGIVEVFLDDDTGCSGASAQGRTFLGSTTSDASGNWSLSTFNVPLSPGNLVTATSSQNTTNSTSQFSAAATVLLACPSTNPVVVRNVNDSGDESLRWACNCVNNNPNLNEINFVIDPPLGGDRTISLIFSPLPKLTPDNVIINGLTQPGGRVTINGSSVNTGNGLELEGDDFIIEGIIISGFPGSGIYTTNTSGGLFRTIGVNSNNFSGVRLNSTSNMTFDNFDAGSESIGIADYSTFNTEVRNSLFQGNIDGIHFGNSTNFLVEFSQFGGTDPGEPNTGIAINVINSTPVKTAGPSIPTVASKFADFAGTIRDNSIYGNGTGIAVEGPSGGNVYLAHISENSMWCNTIPINKSSPSIPIINVATPNLVSGTAPSDSEIEIFGSGDPACPNAVAQGKVYHTTVTADASGNWSATGINVMIGDTLVATATDFDTNANTSQFSAYRIVAPPPCEVSATGTNVTCFKAMDGTGTAVGSLGTPPYSYQWTGGLSGASITALDTGRYIVTLTDGVGCTAMDTIFITQPDSIELNLSAYNVSCFGSSDALVFSNVTGGAPSASNPFYDYFWSTGATTSTLSNVSAGRYILTVTDNNDCMNIDSIDVFQPNKLIVNIDSTNIDCFGADDGTANVNLSITTGGSVNWNNGATSQSISNLSPGTYYVTATDGFCVDTDSVMIEEAPEILLATSSIDFDCFNDGTGEAGVIATGGTPGTPDPYTYLWSTSPPQTSPQIFVPTGGRYFVTVTDGNLCTKIDSTDVYEPDSLQVTISSVDVTCFGENDGLATAIAIGGDSGSYGYDWSNLEINPTIDGLAPGTYSVTVTDGNFCSDTSSVLISEPDKIIISTLGNDAKCFDQADGWATVNVVTDSTNYDYLWSSGDITKTTSASLAAGSYSVTVTEKPAFGTCMDIATVLIDEPDLLVATATGTDVTCFGLDDGTASVSATGGDSDSYSFLWSTGSTNTTISALAPGTYDVTVTDGNGCTDITSVIISEPAKLIISTSGTDVTCFGFNDGFATVNVSGDSLDYTYLWSNGDVTKTIVNLGPGSYTVTVTDNTSGTFTCTDIMSVSIAEPALLTAGITSNDASCFQADDGDAFVSAMGGQVGTYNYSWSNGGTTPFISGLAPGTYTVTVTDANSCETTATTTISEPDKIIVSMSGSDVTCFDFNDGYATVNVFGDSLIYDYLWSNSEITKSIFNLGPGNFKVTVTEDKGNVTCIDTASVNIFEPDELQLSFQTTDVTCFGGSDGETSAIVTGGIQDYTYLWSTGSTSETISGLVEDNYSVTVTDANGCIISGTESVLQPLEFTVSIDAVDVTCFDFADGTASAITVNGIAPFDYDWSNFATTQTATGLAPGTYSVLVTDQTLCTATASIIITQPTAMTLDFDILDVTCFGDYDGFIEANAGGATPPYDYFWSTGETDFVLYDLIAGTYTLTLTDANDCEIIEDAVVTQPTEVVMSFTTTDESCAGAGDGTATATATGGVAPYFYLWNDPDDQTGPTAVGLSAGTYEVEAIDDDGCFALDLVDVFAPPAVSFSIISTDETAFNANDGTAEVTLVSGGTAPITYLWSSGATTPSLSGLAPGNYDCTATDGTGCETILSAIVQAFGCGMGIDALTAIDATCNGGADGSLTLTLLGGVPPINYIWSNGEVTSSISGLTAGSYSVTATDADGCAVTDVGIVNEPSAVTASAITIGLTSNGSNNGSATASASGGTGPYTYLWSTGAASETITGLAPGTYDVTCTDANGCSDDTSVLIAPFDCTFSADSIQILQNVICFGENTGSAAPIVNSGSGPYNFLWSNGTTDSLLIGVPSGTYFVTITDGTNCSDTLMNLISQPDSFALAISTTNELTNGGNDGTAIAMASGGTAPYNFVWSDGQVVQTAVNLMPGNYDVTCTDANGCMISETSIPIQAYVCTMELAASSTSNATCFGFSDGTASANVLSGVNPITYSWNTGDTGASISNITAGTYEVIATDSTNCKDTATVLVNEPDSFQIQITVVDESSSGGNNGSVTAIATGGTPIYTFNWSNGGTTPTITGLMPGTYTLSCTDQNGCQIILDDVEVLEFNCNLEITDIVPTDVLCFGDMDGSLSPIITGQVDPVSYQWSNGSSSSELSGVGAGNYELIVTDAANCKDTLSEVINEPSEIDLNLVITDETVVAGNDGTATVSPSGGTPGYIVSWSTGQSGTSISDLMPGNFDVSVTDDNGCIQTEPFFIQAFGCDLRIESISATAVTCFGDTDGTATPLLIGGVAPFNFDWSDGSSDSLLQNVGGGVFTLNVTDANNCFATANVTVPEPSEINADISGTNETDTDANDGTATVNPTGGTPPFRVSWSNGGTTETISGLAPGTYTATVLDANNCEISADYRVLPFDCGLSIDTLVVKDIDCFGDMNGTIRAFVTGGVGTTIFNWSNGSNSQDLANLEAGTYTLIAIDDLGCTDTSIAEITEPPLLSIDSFRTQDLDCFNDTDGSIQAFVTGGSQPYRFNWSNGETTDNIADLPAGRYGFMVTDDNNCIVTDSADINEPSEIILTISKTDESAADAKDGTASAAASGGTGTLSFVWSNGETTADITDLEPGNYDVSVSDENGCEKMASVTINPFGFDPCDLIIDTLMVTNVRCFGEANGAVIPVLSGGTAPFSFDWNNLTTDSIAANLPSGEIILIVNDANGCVATDTAMVEQPDELIVTISGTDETVSGQNDGTASAQAVGGTSPYNWSWSNGGLVDSIGGLSPGEYTATVMDANGCQASEMISVLMGTDTVPSGVCLTFAGEMSSELLIVCGADSVSGQNIGTPILDSNDILEYVLHTGDGAGLGTIIEKSIGNRFGLGSGMNYDRIYYISAVAGNSGTDGSVDLADTCLSVIAGQPVIFKQLPEPIYSIQGPNLACGNEPFYLIANDLFTGDDVTYSWYLPTGEVRITSEPEITVIPNSEDNTGDYFVSRDSAGCSSVISAPIFIEVVIYPDEAVDAGEDQILCSGQETTIEATSNISEAGKWRSLGFPTVVRPNDFLSPVVDLQPGSNLFVWEVPLNECGAGASDTVNIIIEKPPVLFEDFFTLTNADDRIQLNILDNDLLEGVVDTALTILDDPDFGRIEFDETDGHYYFFLDQSRRGQIEIEYEVCNPRAECSTPCATSRFTINVKALPVLPEGLTLNGDGRNDYLTIKGILGFQRVEVIIANRWGDVVYENKNYSNGDPWRGTLGTDGVELPQGAYYYSVKAFENGVQIEDDIRGVIHIFK